MDGHTGMIIFYCVLVFLGLVIITTIIVMLILWRRRKFIFTNFLDIAGQWERESWLPKELGRTFKWDNETYEFDIKICTRDKLNRPIAHYYKGNPKQQIFKIDNENRTIVIGTTPMTNNDFNVLMKSKVLRDIFQDDEVMNFLMLILVAVGVSLIVSVILIATHNPQVHLKNDNATIDLLTTACKNAISGKIVR